MEKVSRATAEHYVWGGRCDGWRLLAGEGLSVIEERMPPGTEEVRHRHARARQFFYVLEGELTFELEGRLHTLHPREGLEIAPGVAHQVRNTSAADAAFLVISQPSTVGDREPA
jgi:quercetin dioxygenase-like cupin family protein